MREDLREGARLFNDGLWWEAHEAWEGPWARETGAWRSYVQALILLAAALHKRWAHGSLAGRNLVKARRYLADLPDEFDGVDLRTLAAEVERALEEEGRRPQLPV
jgi:predicted metal-dependent hydrolase